MADPAWQRIDRANTIARLCGRVRKAGRTRPNGRSTGVGRLPLRRSMRKTTGRVRTRLLVCRGRPHRCGRLVRAASPYDRSAVASIRAYLAGWMGMALIVLAIAARRGERVARLHIVQWRCILCE
jgi:hypothetical protein